MHDRFSAGVVGPPTCAGHCVGPPLQLIEKTPESVDGGCVVDASRLVEPLTDRCSDTASRTETMCSSAVISRNCSVARIPPPSPPYETNPTGLPRHSYFTVSRAVFNAPGTPWLYSGVTNTKASARPTVRVKRSEASHGTREFGNSKSAKSTSTTSTAVRSAATPRTQAATVGPTRPARTLPTTIASCIGCIAPTVDPVALGQPSPPQQPSVIADRTSRVAAFRAASSSAGG